MARTPVLIQAKVSGQKRLFAHLKHIVTNTPLAINQSNKSIANKIRKDARDIVLKETKGRSSGLLANSITVIPQTKGKITNYTIKVLNEAKNYATPVHDGFRSHWVHRDMIEDWLIYHPEVKLKKGKWLEVGYPKIGKRADGSSKDSANWLEQGGMKFMDKAFAKNLGIALEVYEGKIQQVLKGK